MLVKKYNTVNKVIPLLLVICMVILLPACTAPRPKTPMAVAEAFWNAALAGDIAGARQYLTPESQAHFKIILQSSKDYVELGEQSISADRAEILTRLVQYQSNQNKAQRTALRTILVNLQGQWLVDYNQTRDSMLGSELQSALDHFSSTMRETINKGMMVMEDSVQEELKAMEKSIRELNEEMDQELQKQQQKQQADSKPKTTTL